MLNANGLAATPQDPRETADLIFLLFLFFKAE
jgi:hypothetical protein